MESHIAAASAAQAGLPFAALPRYQRSRQPRPAATGDGRDQAERRHRSAQGPAIAWARNPLTLRALVSTGIDFNRALRSLRGCRGFLLGGGEASSPADL